MSTWEGPVTERAMRTVDNLLVAGGPSITLEELRKIRYTAALARLREAQQRLENAAAYLARSIAEDMLYGQAELQGRRAGQLSWRRMRLLSWRMRDDALAVIELSRRRNAIADLAETLHNEVVISLGLSPDERTQDT